VGRTSPKSHVILNRSFLRRNDIPVRNLSISKSSSVRKRENPHRSPIKSLIVPKGLLAFHLSFTPDGGTGCFGSPVARRVFRFLLSVIKGGAGIFTALGGIRRLFLFGSACLSESTRYTLREERNARSRSARRGEKGRKRCRGMTVTLIERLHTHVPRNLGNSFHCLTPGLPVTIRYDSVLRNLHRRCSRCSRWGHIHIELHVRITLIRCWRIIGGSFNSRVVSLAVFAQSSPKRIEVCARRHTSLNEWMLTGLGSISEA